MFSPVPLLEGTAVTLHNKKTATVSLIGRFYIVKMTVVLKALHRLTTIHTKFLFSFKNGKNWSLNYCLTVRHLKNKNKLEGKIAWGD